MTNKLLFRSVDRINTIFTEKKAFMPLFFSLQFILTVIWTFQAAGQTTVNFNYTGAMQTWTVPPCVTTINVVVAGAKGGGANGGQGARLSATLTVTPGQVLNIYCGGMGTQGNNSGGWNGGGTGYASSDGNAAYHSWGGGGASDIRIGGTALSNRVIVAGGGGGRSGGSSPVCGGAANCNNGAAGCSTFGAGGAGGTQTAGGAGGTPWASTPPGGSAGTLGIGGQGGYWQTASGGGGGGGYYGGGGGGNDGCCTGANGGGGGGGGSSLLPAGGTCLAANNGGHGYVTITYTAAAGTATATNTGPYCAGATIQLNASGGGATSTYSWTGPGGFTSNLQNPTIANSTTAQAGTYNLTINTSGCTAIATTAVVVNALPNVSAGSDQTVCNGTQVTLSGSGATTYSWNNGVNNNVAFTPPLGTTTYTVTGTSSGCTATDQVNVTVNPNPVVDAGQDQTVCDGTSVTLSGSGADTYSWNNGVTDGTSFTPAQGSVTYTVTGTTTAGCSNTDNVTVTVNPNPSPVITGAAQYCQGSTTLLGTTQAFTSYQWSNSTTGSTINATIADSPVTVTVTNGFGCQGVSPAFSISELLPVASNSSVTICQGESALIHGNAETVAGTYTQTFVSANGCDSVATVVLNVNPLPAVAAGNDQFICNGTSTSLSGSGAVTYTWNNGVVDGATFTPAPGTVTYTVTGTDANGCVNTDQVSITVYALPNVQAGADQTICEGSNATLSAAGASTYTWDNGVTNNVPFAPAVGTLTYTVTGTDVNGCVNSDQVNVTVAPTPVVSFISDVMEGCTPLTVNLTNTGTVGSDCNWTLSDGTVLYGCGTVTHVIEQAGCHDVTLTVTSSIGCIGTATITDMICTENPPIAAFIPSPPVITEYNTEVSFMNTSTGAVNYQWDFGYNNGVSSSDEPTFDYDGAMSSQVATLIALTPLGCADTASTVIVFEEDIIYYIPNTFTPDGDMVNQTFQPVFTSGFDPFNFSMYIYNRWGELIFETHNADIGWDGTYGQGSKNVGIVQDGIYTWRIEFKPKNNDNKFVKTGHVTVIR